MSYYDRNKQVLNVALIILITLLVRSWGYEGVAFVALVGISLITARDADLLRDRDTSYAENAEGG